MGKLIFLDIDGTIRNFDGSIPASAAQAIRAARQNGHEVLLCSGRALCQIEQSVIDLGVDGIVSSSGGHVLYHDTCIREVCFEPEFLKELAGMLLENHCLIQTQGCEKTCILWEQAEAFIELGKSIQSLLGEGAKALVDPPKPEATLEDCGNVEKLVYYSDRLSNDALRERFGDRLYIVPLSFPNAVKFGGEISPADSNKAEAIRAILTLTGKETADVVAVGDSQNDVEMISFAGFGIAMGNATEGAKAAADWVTDRIENDGLYKAFKKAGLC